MPHNEATELDWIIPILHDYQADALSILGDLIKAGMLNGVCSVNDIRCHPDNPRIISACMKVLKVMGFTHTTEKIPDIRLGKKGKVSVWELTDAHKVQTYLDYQMQYFITILHERAPLQKEKVAPEPSQSVMVDTVEPY